VQQEVWQVVVVGAGAAGLIAALRAAERGKRVLLLEKNRQPGVKILMSGGTRCNITQACDNRGIVAAYGEPGKFLHSALAAFSVEQTTRFFNDAGVATKVEETGKVFPVSNRAADVLDALVRRLRFSGATLALEEPLVEMHCSQNSFQLVSNRRTIHADKIILTTGGQSYPGSGTTGDGYRWAAALGHTIVTPRPALTPISVSDAWVKQLSGVTISDVAVRVLEQSTELARRRGSFLFTHFGLSGPVVLDVSRAVSGHPRPASLKIECDYLPAKPQAAIAEELKARAAAAGKKTLSSILPEVLPQRLHEALCVQAGVRFDRKAAELTKVERAALVAAYKSQTISIAGTRGFGQAEVTSGGVALDEVDSRTMQSKLVPGLYLAGEILDLDGPIGGYNFQAAWSTGWLAGSSV
jgi:predicted Rossmann fold flavoprotein